MCEWCWLLWGVHLHGDRSEKLLKIPKWNLKSVGGHSVSFIALSEIHGLPVCRINPSARVQKSVQDFPVTTQAFPQILVDLYIQIMYSCMCRPICVREWCVLALFFILQKDLCFIRAIYFIINTVTRKGEWSHLRCSGVRVPTVKEQFANSGSMVLSAAVTNNSLALAPCFVSNSDKQFAGSGTMVCQQQW